MKNKKLIIALCAMLLVGGISLAVGLLLGGETNVFLSKSGYMFKKESKVEMVKEIITNDVENIDVDVDLVDEISIIFGSDFSVSYDKSRYNLEIDDNTLSLSQIDEENKIFSFGFDFNDNHEEITITVPKNTVLENLNIDLDVGELELENITANRLDLYIDIGDAQIENSNFIDVNMQTDIGDISMENCEIQNRLEAITDIGDVDLSDCAVGDYSKFKMDIGDLEMDLIGNKNDYDINALVELGEFKIDGKNVDAQDNFSGGDKIIVFEVSSGDCELDFK